jgi:serine protease Do
MWNAYPGFAKALRSLIVGGLVLASFHPARADPCTKTADEVFASAAPSTVMLTALQIDPFDNEDRIRVSWSSGFVVDRAGTVVTSFHGLLNQRRIVASSGGQSLGNAEFVAGDAPLDLAVLRVASLAGEMGPTPLPFAPADSLRAGQGAFLIGYPNGQKPSITAGVLSAMEVTVPRNSLSWSERYLQTDAAINFGNSGGPLLDACARVIGVASMMAPRSQGIGYAIPSDLVQEVIRDLKSIGHVTRPWLGLGGRMVDDGMMAMLSQPLTRGFLVETVEPGSDGERAGLNGGTIPVRMMFGNSFLIGGDIVTKVNGADLTSAADVSRIARALKPGDDVSFEYFRNGLVRKGKVKLTNRPSLPDDIRVLYRGLYGQPAANQP